MNLKSMGKINFREQRPVRTCTKTYKNYRNYKLYLAEDFYHKCGYTNCSDFWFGGIGNFHIDHFIPWSKHIDQPELKTDYQNLVYCCSYVNILKSDDITPYLDPCVEDYNLHFQRDKDGAIVPITLIATYMYNRMKMYLFRYKIIWMLDNLEFKMSKLRCIIEQTGDIKAKDLYIQLAFEYEDYKKYLRANQ